LKRTSYDFLIIGGGSAGYAAARTAAELGLNTAVVEGAREIGGLCILRGCMPSKTLIESANRFAAFGRAAEFGLHIGDTGFSAPEIIARKRRLISEFADYRRGQLESGKFDLIRGCAEFIDPHTLSITAPDGNRSILEAATSLIATGSRINPLPVPCLAGSGCLTSDDILDLEKLPASIIVLGAGAIALEMSHYLSALGCDVTIVQRSPQIFKGADEDVALTLRESFEKRGVHIFTDTTLRRVSRDATGSEVTFGRPGQPDTVLRAEAVLNALGRHPATAGLGLDRAGVELRGANVRTSSDQRTNQPHIFAAGDVCGPHEIVHIAIGQGEIAARNAARALGKLGGDVERSDYRLKLFAIFTEPQVAMVGLTEREAREMGVETRSASYPFADHGKSIVMGETEGFVKLIVARETGKILGAAVIGPHASELIHEVVVAMGFGATAAEFATIPHYHPTLSEIWSYPAEDLA